MVMQGSATPIVVGIDGSRAAIGAALWAADEAQNRGVPLRLVHIVTFDEEDSDLDEEPAEVGADWPETEYGRTALRAASAAVHGTGKPINIETELCWGEIDLMLIRESEAAQLVCVGSAGITPFCERTLGSTAVTLAEEGHSSVAVIRTPAPASKSEHHWIVTVVDDSPECNAVVDCALDEARLRRAPLLALAVSHDDDHHVLHQDELGRRIASWRDRHPYLHIYPVVASTGIEGFLAGHDELVVQLAVVGAADATKVSSIVGPPQESGQSHSRCSVLVVR
jgi:nucleotide-binding universal stress UspA family protein